MYSSILMPVDLGDESSWNKSLPVAVGLARDFKAQLHVVSVVPPFGMPLVGSFFPADFEEKSLKLVSEAMKEFVATNVPPDIGAKPHVAHGTIYEEVIAAADKLGCDLIVMASHRPATKGFLLGPNAARVVRHAAQSVFIVRGLRQ